MKEINISVRGPNNSFDAHASLVIVQERTKLRKETGVAASIRISHFLWEGAFAGQGSLPSAVLWLAGVICEFLRQELGYVKYYITHDQSIAASECVQQINNVAGLAKVLALKIRGAEQQHGMHAPGVEFLELLARVGSLPEIGSFASREEKENLLGALKTRGEQLDNIATRIKARQY